MITEISSMNADLLVGAARQFSRCGERSRVRVSRSRRLYETIGGEVADQGDTTNYWWDFDGR